MELGRRYHCFSVILFLPAGSFATSVVRELILLGMMMLKILVSNDDGVMARRDTDPR